MEIPTDLLCLFNSEIEERNGSYLIEVPKQEVEIGTLQPNQIYRVAMLSGVADTETTRDEPEQEPERERGPPEPPVEEGEIRELISKI